MKEVIILAGGLGTRLKKVVKELPKCLAPIGEKTFLYFCLQNLKKQGFQRFIFALGFQSEKVINYIKSQDFGIEYVFSVEQEQLGTGGCIKKALGYIKSEDVLVVNGDTFFYFDINNFYQFHISKKSLFSIALTQIKNTERYGSVEINQDGDVIAFKEKNSIITSNINSGFYFINNHFNFNNYGDKFSIEKDFFEDEKRGVRLKAKIFKGEFLDIGTPDDYFKSQTFVNKS
jgi:D-glycero-alpha-D-manno-heptose 1-phosphate guanylyltransferase